MALIARFLSPSAQQSLANPQHTLLGEIAISNPARVDVHHSRTSLS